MKCEKRTTTTTTTPYPTRWGRRSVKKEHRRENNKELRPLHMTKRAVFEMHEQRVD